MRILHVITRLIIGGAQENTLLTCEDLLRRHGDDVLLATGPPLGPEGSLLQRGRAGGVPLQIVPSLRRAINPLRDVASYRAIAKIIRQFQPDVVHTHSGKAGLLARVAAHRAGVPAILHTVHGAPFHPYQGRGARAIFRSCERYAAARCDALVSVADAMTDLLVSAGVAPREKFVTVYSGMEVDPLLEADKLRDATRRELGYEPQYIVVGKVARLFHLKGHEYLIAAARQVVAAHPQVRFLLVGDGVLAGTLQQQVERQGLTSYFKFAGLMAPERMPAMLAAMDVVVHTSLREGLARVLPQALIVGRPVVSYDIDGAREVVENDRTGYLLPPKSIDELAEAICRLAGDAALRARLGAADRQRFAEQFRHELKTAELRALYEKILAGKGRAVEVRPRSLVSGLTASGAGD